MIRSEVSRALSSIQRGGTFDLQASDELIDDMRNFTSLISRKKYKEKRQGALDEQLKKSEAKSRLYNKSYRRRWNSGTSGASDASTPTPSLSSNPTAKLRKHESTRRRTAPISSSLSVKPRPRPRVRTGTGSSRRDRVKKEVLSRGRRRRSSTGLGGPNPYRSLVEEELKSSNVRNGSIDRLEL